MKKLFAKALVLMAILGLTSMTVSAKQYYKDVPEGHWAYKYLEILTDCDIVVGYPDGLYRPDQLVTRAEFSSIVVKAFDQEFSKIINPKAYTDVAQWQWFYGVVQRATQFNLMTGYPDGRFKPYGTVERGHVISTVVNALTTESVSADKAKDILAKKYSDYKDIPAWLIIAAGKAEELGLVVSEPGKEGEIAAQRPATRAELAAFIVKMMEKAKEQPNEKLKEAMKPRYADGIVVPATFDGYIATIPAGTVIPIMVLNKEITSQKAKSGADFSSRLPRNIITKERYLLLVENDTMNGKIDNVKKGRLFVRDGVVGMKTETINTDRAQTAGFVGYAFGPDRLEGFWKTLYLKVIKGHRVIVREGDILNLKLEHPIRVDLTNGLIIE